VSFRAAAALWALPGFKTTRVEVTITAHRNRAGDHEIIVHAPRIPIPPGDITTLDAIPVTKPARTLLDIATVEAIDAIERCLDDALRRRLVSVPFLERWLQDPLRTRHRGARVLRRLVEERALRGVADSPLETRYLQLSRDLGLPSPMLQYVVKDQHRFVARLDFAYPEKRVGIEVDGFRHHDIRRTFDRERARGNALEALGWRILRVTAGHDPDEIASWIRRALDA
jgi:hypothetical protein